MPQVANVSLVLEASTGHLSAQIAQAIVAGEFPIKPMFIRDEGFMFWVPNNSADIKSMQQALAPWAFRSQPFLACVFHAWNQGCAYILFDRDSGAIPGLPFFDW